MKAVSVKILFRFTFKDGGTMEAPHIGTSEISYRDAEFNAWQDMADDNFDRRLIFKVTKIEVISKEVL
jgi:hypothetical protein